MTTISLERLDTKGPNAILKGAHSPSFNNEGTLGTAFGTTNKGTWVWIKVTGLDRARNLFKNNTAYNK